jgi:hypothetical protein
MRLIPVAFLIIALPGAAEPTNPRATEPGRDEGQLEISFLTAKMPLAELSPVPFSADEERMHSEVDAEICSAYRRWRTQGNRTSAHIEAWCPSAP